MIRGRIALALLLAACGGEDAAPARATTAAAPGPPAPPRFLFTDVSAASGLTAVSWCGRPEKPHLLESGGCGLGLLDYDGDGLLDVYLVTGWRLEGDRVAEKPANRLYRNRGRLLFEDVTEKAGVGDDGFGCGVAVGDVDGDGRPDLFVSNFGPDVLYRNRGDGTFERVAGGPSIDGWSTGACFFDADQDGDQDLFVAGYVDCTLEQVLQARPTLDWKGTKVMFGPFGLEGLEDRFFRNDGGRFVEATKEAGLTDVGEYFGFTAAACDFDGDLDLDLFVANDSNPNYVYRNDGGGKFTEVGLWCGAAMTGEGATQAGMGVGVGDPDGDLLPDMLLTTFADDAATLFRNCGKLRFEDVAKKSGVRDPTFKPLKWGVVFADFDQDGDEDLFIANGHIYPQADTTPAAATTWAQRNTLLENAGPLKFRDATTAAGPGLDVVRSSRGVAAGDLDGDGDIDLVVSNVDAPPTVLRNDAPRAGGRLLVDAPGALRVTVETRDASGAVRKQGRWGVAGGSYCSASDPRFHFGLGAAANAVVTVTWPGGKETTFPDAAAGGALHATPPR